ncbi:MAG: hypothetical protein A2W93_00665 [Bacteroidetes bacterium GWF2_43_63]|nr:MAG: hypothetical protein A2W94_10985 [Bacteroidetes bacterium GWE2_42_42]OFY54972.1 MAG: hypothetical protein A2W93_00665 [Bacteroidetes bacterium GWF2_43_63]HBG69520.1 hypothetical protein [Bacteroidales bacterium]HCB61313.1 hypothetical protein [Bacteroidales bacterium]
MNKGIFIRLRASRTFKFIMAFAGVSMLNSLFFPMIAKADGPIAPEFSSFEQVNATQMVDPFTGDFSYNIPLFTVPGPDGGYPINLIYNAGITPDQEASWVGLGWNLNVGAITRQMRGVPDDFDGTQMLSKDINVKPNVNVELGGELGIDLKEILGVPIENAGTFQGSVGLQLIYDNYKGLGIGTSAGIAVRFANSVGINAGVAYDPNTGMNLSAGASYDRNKSFSLGDLYGVSAGIGICYNSREAALTTSVSSLRTTLSTIRSSYTPEVTIPYTSTAYDFRIKSGTEILPGVLTSVAIDGRYSSSKPTTNNLSIPIFGYLHNQGAYTNPRGIRDYSTSYQYPMSKEIKMLSTPISTYDIMTVNAQGIGMTFRPFRSDVPIMSPAYSTSVGSSNGIGGEYGEGISTHLGFNTSSRVTESHSGRWSSGNTLISTYMSATPPLGYESFYFKAVGDETCEQINSDERFRLDETICPTISNVIDFGSSENDVNVIYNLSGPTSVFNSSKYYRENRDLRSSNIEYYTNSEARSIFENKVSFWVGSNQETYEYLNNNNEIGAYVITGQDGGRYEFALPVYSQQSDVIFAIDESTTLVGNEKYFDALIDYDPLVDPTIENLNGNDHLYSNTKIPKYASQYNLTAVYSADYVDLTYNGPSEDDLGNYTKFEYEKKSDDYGMRYPFLKANYMPGNYSNDKDDKAAYSYYTREQYYLKTIETKTHIAIFRISYRNDGRGASEDNESLAGSNSMLSYKLDQIDLYCKTDPQFNPNTSIPVKSIHFEYMVDGDELCQGAPGSDPGSGKLTLAKVWFEYKGNTSGESSAYVFDYGTGLINNPDYASRCSDKWGYFKHQNSGETNFDNPYVSQYSGEDEVETLNGYAGAWSLKKITLPSGGTIEVEYEMDDYAYVQNIPAMHMAKIKFTGNQESGVDSNNKISKSKNRLYFELENTQEGSELYYDGVVKNAFINQKFLYFRTYMSLRNSENNCDYVNGFAEIDKDSIGNNIVGCKTVSGNLYGYVDVKPVPVKKNDLSREVHPITKAAWQYLYNDRPDLFYPDQENQNFGLDFIQSIVGLFQELATMILGVYNFMYISGFGNNLKLDSNHPSFIRIPDLDGRMYGGGHRVKSISLKDNWGDFSPTEKEKSSDYTQTFSYTLPDGRSSGVASYEPKTGEDECAMRQLLYTYSGDNIREYDYFNIKGPVCEDFFPSPQVGYSRVVVNNGSALSSEQSFNKSGAGYEVYEFYTAKDFPVIEKWSPITVAPPFEQSIPIPLCGSKIYNKYAFSQGFSVTTNDMHGKQKSHSTYKEADECNNHAIIPVSETKYYYHTQNPYSCNAFNKLDNNVDVLYSADNIENTEVGVARDFFMDTRENRMVSETNGMQMNVTLLRPLIFPVPIIPIPFAAPIKNYIEAETKTTSTIKVVHQTGILEKIVSTAEGRKSETNLLAYDAATGQPLWSSTNNEFDRPVYTYSYPAHWYYSGMGLASSNYRFTLASATASSGVVGVGSSYINWFEPGDVMLSGGNKYWVSDVNKTANEITIRNENDDLASGSLTNLTIIQSGHRNLLLEQCGKTDALNWFGAADKALADVYVELWNSIFDYSTHYVSQSTNNQFEYYTATLDCQESFVNRKEDCISGCDEFLQYKQNLVGNTLTLLISSDNEGSGIENFIPSIPGASISVSFNTTGVIVNPAHSNILFIEAQVAPDVQLQNQPCTLHVIESGAEKLIAGVFNSEQSNSVKNCIDERILHSEAYEYSDDAERIYADAGTLGVTEATIASNPFRYGAKGRWGRDNSYLYYANRLQSTAIDIEVDGPYKHYTPFDWTGVTNSEWWKTSEVTQWSVDGIPLETKDRLGNYSSILYGHLGVDRSTLTAAASNCTYYEMAYDGFEDHGSTYDSDGRGHLKFLVYGQSSPALSSDVSHTGKYSVWLGAGSSNAMVYTYDLVNPVEGWFAPQVSSESESKKYVVSAWVNMQGDETNAVTINVVCNGNSLGSFVVNNTGTKVDGWKLVSGVFTMPSTVAGQLSISISSGYARAFIDDIRIHPFNSQMVTAVYDAKTMRISAILDENNYASYFTYDLQGNLVQVKKETEKGKQTVKSSWQNIFKTTGN